MIILGDTMYETEGLSERPALQQFSTQVRSTTGVLVQTQAQFVSNERSYTLLVNAAHKESLRQQLAQLGLFSFVDETGFLWSPETGTDDDLHAYSTGAYFIAGTRLVFVPQQANGALACDQLWQVDVTFIINALGVNGGSAGGDVILGELIEETPAGTVDGANNVFTLTNVPSILFLFRNGVEQYGNYSLVGSTITFTVAPALGSVLRAFYQV